MSLAASVEDLGSVGRFEHLYWLDSTASTNADAIAEARGRNAGAGGGGAFAVAADHQSSGRGRRSRDWLMSPGGGLPISAFVPWRNDRSLQLLPIAMGVALFETITALGVDVGLKWPNDLISVDPAHADRKLSGMLSEVVHSQQSPGRSQPLGAVLGCGINVAWPTEQDAVDDPAISNAVSLTTLGVQSLDRRELARKFLLAIDADLERLETHGQRFLIDRYIERCRTIGRDVRVATGSDEIDGRATGVDDSGRLLVRTEAGQVAVAVGDVEHLRAV